MPQGARIPGGSGQARRVSHIAFRPRFTTHSPRCHDQWYIYIYTLVVVYIDCAQYTQSMRESCSRSLSPGKMFIRFSFLEKKNTHTQTHTHILCDVRFSLWARRSVVSCTDACTPREGSLRVPLPEAVVVAAEAGEGGEGPAGCLRRHGIGKTLGSECLPICE